VIHVDPGTSPPRVARIAVIFNADINTQILGGGGYAAPIAAAAIVYGVQVIWTPYRTAVEAQGSDLPVEYPTKFELVIIENSQGDRPHHPRGIGAQKKRINPD
jgi:hypothetical protein